MDRLSPEKRSKLMGRVRGKNTTPEIAVRRMLRSMGVGYRLHAGDLPGRPDIVFKSRRKVIFVHGCFWHRHPDPACRKCGMPKSRQDFWSEKFARNIERDAKNQGDLKIAGWDVLVIWQCELANADAAFGKLRSFLCETELPSLDSDSSAGHNV